MGRKKSDDAASDHVAVPLSSLKDPGSFAPPPKRRGTGLEPAPVAVSTPRKVITAPSKYQDPRAASVQPPVGQKQIAYAPEQEVEQEPEEERPPQPYRVNTTGFSTAGLPPPPGRRDGADGRSQPPPSYQAATAGPPVLPPRLPPRTNSGSSTVSSPVTSPAPTGNSGYLNQGAVSRLGAAGVSVPGFGIGRSSPANASSPSPPPPRPAAASPSHMNELQNRFSRLGTSSPAAAAAASPNPPAQGTTWAQKQAALKTASSFQKDPSSVSLTDARAAASTANNFRQRHGEQVAAGVKTANGLNQKYGVMEKVGGYANNGNGNVANGQAPNAALVAASPIAGLAAKKKPPPPPPKGKKPLLLQGAPTPAASSSDDAPPPIPLATRPQF